MSKRERIRPTLKGSSSRGSATGHGKPKKQSHVTLSIVFKNNPNVTNSVVHPEHVNLHNSFMQAVEQDELIANRNTLARETLFSAIDLGIVNALADVRYAKQQWQAAEIDANATVESVVAAEQVDDKAARDYIMECREYANDLLSDYVTELATLAQTAQTIAEEEAARVNNLTTEQLAEVGKLAQTIRTAEQRQKRRDAVESLTDTETPDGAESDASDA